MFATALRRATVLGLGISATAAAQSPIASQSSQRSSFSLSAVQSRPQGDFALNVERGYGVDGAYLFRLDDAGFVSLRASVGGISYGRESRQSAFSESVGGRVQVDVSTNNYIIPVSVGPQLSWPRGRVRPYINAGVGGQFFYSESQVQGLRDGPIVASTTNHSSSSASWNVGGGVNIPVYAGRTRVMLEAGAQYVAGATARYLTKGSIVDLPNAQTAITPSESSTHMTIIRLGARIAR